MEVRLERRSERGKPEGKREGKLVGDGKKGPPRFSARSDVSWKIGSARCRTATRTDGTSRDGRREEEHMFEGVFPMAWGYVVTAGMRSVAGSPLGVGKRLVPDDNVATIRGAAFCCMR